MSPSPAFLDQDRVPSKRKPQTNRLEPSCKRAKVRGHGDMEWGKWQSEGGSFWLEVPDLQYERRGETLEVGGVVEQAGPQKPQKGTQGHTFQRG